MARNETKRTNTDGESVTTSTPDSPNATNGNEPLIVDGTGSSASTEDFSYPVRDPADLTGGNTTPKRRGRPIGSRNAAKAQAIPGNLDALTALLLSVHTMGAALLLTPELALDPAEAKQLAKAADDVRRFYPVIVSDKMMAWFTLIGVCGAIYGPRGVTVYNRMKQAAKPPRLVAIDRKATPPVQPNAEQKVNGADKTQPASAQPVQFTPSQFWPEPPRENNE